MRGLEEIKHRNENPNGFHGGSNEHEQFRPSQRPFSPEEGDDEVKTHGDLATETFNRLIVNNGGRVPADKGRLLQELFATAMILDVLGIPAPTDLPKPRTLADRSRLNDKGDRFLGMDGIHSAIDAKPDFLRFWQKLNEDRAAGGSGEARYGEAKEAFNGGPTPTGALTFIGKEWDGLRAVPAKPIDGKKTYHGEFRQASTEGTVWRVVANFTEGPIAYATPEAALHGARHGKLHAEKHQS